MVSLQETTSGPTPVAALAEQISTRVAELLAHEKAPGGVPPPLLEELLRSLSPGGSAEQPAAAQYGLYELWAAMTALVQETKLQGRAFKGLQETVEPLLEPLVQSEQAQRALAVEVRELLDEERRRAAELRREAAAAATRAQLDLLLDLRERLVRGAESAAACRAVRAGPRWLSWLRPGGAELRRLREAVDGLHKGSIMTLDRLDDALTQAGVEVVDCGGALFDPSLMSAVDVEETATVAQGTVLEVVRPAYLLDGEVLRPALVKVARQPASR